MYTTKRKISDTKKNGLYKKGNIRKTCNEHILRVSNWSVFNEGTGTLFFIGA
jgi:hypothetical protein